MYGAGGAGFRVGQPVATLTYGGFSEFAVESARFVVPVPQASAAVVSFLTSGLTASVSLDEARPQQGETALVTAAAGGTGLFAVQLLKLAGLHVIGTCSSQDKAQLLTRLGVDRVVNYKVEDLKKVRGPEMHPGASLLQNCSAGASRVPAKITQMVQRHGRACSCGTCRLRSCLAARAN